MNTPFHRPHPCALALVCVCVAGTAAAQAQDASRFPAKPIRLIVPFPPGGSNDILGRFMAQKLGAEYIVIGSHGHSAAYDVLMGSVASGVVKKSPCSVLVVPPISAEVKAETGPTTSAVSA